MISHAQAAERAQARMSVVKVTVRCRWCGHEVPCTVNGTDVEMDIGVCGCDDGPDYGPIAERALAKAQAERASYAAHLMEAGQ